jgi:hypothetical protein
LSENSPEGRKRRKIFQQSLHNTKHEIQGLGIEMNQRYTGPGAAIYKDDEDCSAPPGFKRDPILYYEPTTYPGCRLPHAWLSTLVPTERVSTIDLTGHGQFTILTGIGGRELWEHAAQRVIRELRIPIKVYAIGFRQDYEDVYMDWANLREVDEDGAVLVRPDRFVAWRSKTIPEQQDVKLVNVLRRILFL